MRFRLCHGRIGEAWPKVQACLEVGHEISTGQSASTGLY